MKKNNRLILFIVLGVVACTCKVHQTPEEKQPFTFSTWITAKKGKTDAQYLEEFKKYAHYGITEVLINTLADPKELARLVPLATQSGLKVHAWMFTTNRPGDTVALQHPDWYMVSRSGKSCFDDRPYVDYYQWLSPSHPAARKHILSLVEGLSKVAGIETVHLDYIRYPDVYLPVGLLPKYNLQQETELPDFDFDYSDAAVEKFKALHHKDPRLMSNPAIDMEWKNFRLNEIRSLVNEAYKIVHNNGKELSAAVFPYPEMADHMVRQRWDKWDIDKVFPMLYYRFYNEELDWIGYATSQGIADLKSKNTALCAGIYLPDMTPQDLKKVIQMVKKKGAVGVSIFDGGAITEAQFKTIQSFAKAE